MQNYTMECTYNGSFQNVFAFEYLRGWDWSRTSLPCITVLIVDVGIPNLTETAPHNIYRSKKFNENDWKVFDESVSWIKQLKFWVQITFFFVK